MIALIGSPVVSSNYNFTNRLVLSHSQSHVLHLISLNLVKPIAAKASTSTDPVFASGSIKCWTLNSIGMYSVSTVFSEDQEHMLIPRNATNACMPMRATPFIPFGWFLLPPYFHSLVSILDSSPSLEFYDSTVSRLTMLILSYAKLFLETWTWLLTLCQPN